MADIDIIGGSAAGLFAGYLLAREGKNVRLFDANDVLNVESRTLITTSRLNEVLGFFPQEAVVNQIDQIDLYSPRRSVSILMRDPDLVVERAAVIGLLARKALDAGVELRGGCKLVDLKPGDKDVTVTIRDTHRDRTEKFKAKTLIGADGMSSRVAKSATGNSLRTTPLLQAIIELPQGSRRGTTQVWFEPADTPYFYWLIPQSRTHAAVGFIAEEGKTARGRLERFLGRIGLKAVEMQSARIPSYTHSTRPWRRVAGCNLYLIGDAAGQVKVTTVGGLVTGLRGARAAANAILQGSNYMKELRSLRRELSLHLVIRNALNRFSGADYDRLLDLLNEKTIGLLGMYNRDQAAGLLCRILLAQPRFITFAGLVSWRRKQRLVEDGAFAETTILNHEADM
ncbi:MAG TPA: NAD(P)/FAD-dependent oxidoreductase [Candidatus Binatia bacterium]